MNKSDAIYHHSTPMNICSIAFLSVLVSSPSGCGCTDTSPATNHSTAASDQFSAQVTTDPEQAPTLPVIQDPLPVAGKIVLPTEVDFSKLDAKDLIAYGKKNSIAIDIDDTFQFTFYPADADKKFIASVIDRKDDIIRELKPDEWIQKELVGKWEHRVPNQVSTIKFRADGLLQLDRQDSNVLMRALNSAINGTILYQWSYSDGRLHFKNVASEKQRLDKLRFLSDSQKSKLEMKGKKSFSLTDPNALGMGEWTRIGR